MTAHDVAQVAALHRRELHGFLSELGPRFLERFYEATLEAGDPATVVDEDAGEVRGFVSWSPAPRGLIGRTLRRAPFRLTPPILVHLLRRPTDLARVAAVPRYPGLASDVPELLSLAVSDRHRGLGLGRALFGEVARGVAALGAPGFRVSVYDGLPANAFYARVGCRRAASFAFLGRRMNYYEFDVRAAGPA